MVPETGTSINSGPGFSGVDIPRDEDLYRCVHCGLCLSSCPTYLETKLETESPRGRIALMKAVKEGRLGISQRVSAHWEMCLQCRACEAVCPSGVPFGRLMESTRAQVLRHGKESWRLRLVKGLFLRAALPHLTRLRLAAALLRTYQRWGLQLLIRRSSILKFFPGGLAGLEAGIPQVSRKFFGPTTHVYSAMGESKMSVGLLSGCIMPIVQAPTMEAAVSVLNRNGCDVAVPVGQGCCGALNLHSGDIDTGRKIARRNIDAFLTADVEKVVVASAGCGSAMKEYGELLKDDPHYSEKAERLSAMTFDITEFLVSLPFHPPGGEVRERVTYQHPCHLAHAQRITDAPTEILKSIPGLELVEMQDASHCCGGAGIYFLTQRRLSRRLLEGKMKNVAETGADMVVTANPGCVIQLQTGLRLAGIPGGACHVVDLLDQAYRGES